MMSGTRPQPPDAPIAITGMGVLSPIGQGVEAFWSSLLNGVSGITSIERFPTHDLRVRRGGEIKQTLDTPGLERPLPACRASQFLIHAATEATRMARLSEAAATRRVAVVIGSALGGIAEAERWHDQSGDLHALAGAPYDGPTRQLARWLKATGPVLTISTACASGATSLGVGADLLRAGAATAVVAGGVDVLCRFVMRGFNHLRSLTRDEVRPFDRRRKGLLLGEGAGLVVLERAQTARQRGITPYGYLLGHASCADGAHITAPDPQGRGLEQSIRLALANAGVRSEEIEFISAHGTGTPLNDRMETQVFKKVLGARAYEVPVNSIKAHMGHTMGAAATLETIMCLLAWRDGQIPPTLNYGEPDPECDLPYVTGQARTYRPRLSLNTAAGFGGCNACLVLAGGE
ncbi:MAG TPA: beta-ketoacyl-[acyl-carrier-protein] synthase family protein [Candidatus Tectomicrobia bacterium]